MHGLPRAALLAALAMTAVTAGGADMPSPAPVTGPGVTGTVVRYASMPSVHVEARNVDVWLPLGYGQDSAEALSRALHARWAELFDHKQPPVV